MNLVIINDNYCKNDCIDSTHSLNNVVNNNTVTIPESELMSSSELFGIENDNTTAISPVATQPPVSKRIYQKISQNQINVLKGIYTYKGPFYPILKYCDATGIKPNRLKCLIRKLQRGEEIDKSVVKKGRKKKLTSNESKILADVIKKNDKTTLKAMKAIIKEKSNIQVSESTIHRELTSKMHRADKLKNSLCRELSNY